MLVVWVVAVLGLLSWLGPGMAQAGAGDPATTPGPSPSTAVVGNPPGQPASDAAPGLVTAPRALPSAAPAPIGEAATDGLSRGQLGAVVGLGAVALLVIGAAVGVVQHRRHHPHRPHRRD